MITYLNKSNKKRVVSTLFLYLLIIFLFACDFEQPEKWETPSWYINLTVPLTNEQYYFDGMLQDDVILEDTTNNTMGILFSGDIASGGEKPGITDAIFDFKIDRNEQSNLLDLPIDPIDKMPPSDITAPIEIPITLSMLVENELGFAETISENCIRYSDLKDNFIFPDDVANEFPIDFPYSILILGTPEFQNIIQEVTFEDDPVIESIRKITFEEGRIGAEITNNLPFPVKNIHIIYKSIEYDANEEIVKEISLSGINAIQPNGIAVSEVDIISSNNLKQFGDELQITVLVEIDKDLLVPDAGVCLGQDGWILNGTADEAKLSIALDFLIASESSKNIICTTNPLYKEQVIEPADSIKVDNLQIKGGKISEEFSDITSSEINYIKLIASNSLFNTVDLEIEFYNFFEKIEGLDRTIKLGGQIPPTNIETTFSEILSEKYLGIPNMPDEILNIIQVIIKVEIPQLIDSAIPFGEAFGFSFSSFLMSEIQLAYLTAVSGELEFDTPSSTIAGVPSGTAGFTFYDVQLLLDIYTQIGVPLQLNMELSGIKGEESVITLIDPELNVPEINTEGDSVRTLITLNRDGQLVEYFDKNGEPYLEPIFTPADENQSTIVDVMNLPPDEITFSGGASMRGEGFLAPNSYLWGTFTLNAPMAFLFEENTNIIPASPTEMAPMDAASVEQFDSSLVRADLSVSILNSSPLGGSLSLLISDNTIFPLFLDSLVTGTWNDNLVKQSEYGLGFDTQIWDTLDVEINGQQYDNIGPPESITVTPINIGDAFGEPVLRVDFSHKLSDENDETFNYFVGRMFMLDFPASDSIDYQLGYVNPEFPNETVSTIDLNIEKLKWIITEELRYNISMITFNQSPTYIPAGETQEEFIPITFQTTNSIDVLANLTIILDTQGLGRVK